MNHDFVNKIKTNIASELKFSESLAKYTTIGIGGAAEYFLSINSQKELIQAVKIAKEFKIPITIIGGGSNIVIADQGLKGLVIRNQILDLQIIESQNLDSNKIKVSPRLGQVSEIIEKQGVADYLIDENLSSFDENSETIIVKVGAGWKNNPLILKLFSLGITGLEWFGGIPGSMGGAIYMNIHGGKKFISDFVVSVDVLDKNGDLQTLLPKDLKFDYDQSIFQSNKMAILSANLKLYKGDIQKAQKIFNWAKKKIISQPQRTAGCVFQNLSEEQKQRLGLKSPSMGYIIDQVLNLKGTMIGGAKISDSHAAFIENVAGATSADVLQLVELVEKKMWEKFKIKIKREIEFIK